MANRTLFSFTEIVHAEKPSRLARVGSWCNMLGRGLPINPQWADVTGWGAPQYGGYYFIFNFSKNELSEEAKLGWIARKIKEECCAANQFSSMLVTTHPNKTLYPRTAQPSTDSTRTFLLFPGQQMAHIREKPSPMFMNSGRRFPPRMRLPSTLDKKT